MSRICYRCPHRCSGIGRGFTGFCGVVLVDDKGVRDKYQWMVTAITASVIEKIPLYHFYPGSWSINLWVPGCPYTCSNCPWNAVVGGEDAGSLYVLKKIDVGEIIDYYNQVGANVVSVLGGEPLVQEWVIELLGKLKSKNTNTVVRTTLAVSKDIIEKLHVDAILIDIPLLTGSTPPIDTVMENMELIKRKDIHCELLLSIDKTSILRWTNIVGKLYGLDKNTPIHIQIVEPVNWKTIKKIIGGFENSGFNHIYLVGDTSGEYSTTYCPSCKTPLIIRDRYGVREILLVDNRCPKCGSELKIIGGLAKGKQRRVSRLLASGERILWSP